MRSLHIISIYIIATILTGCSDDSLTPAPEPAPEAVHRNLLIYMVSNNSLGTSNFDQYDINEMMAAAKEGFGDNRVLLFRAATDRTQTLNEVTPEGLVTLATYDSSISAISPERIQAVISDSRTLAPADDYALVLWSHSDAWLSPTSGSDASQQRSFGDDGGKHLAIPDLASALEPWEFSYIYFDCCYMANVETLYEMRHCADWAVASAIELPAAGMNYTVNLPLLLLPEPDLTGAARATYNYYNALTDENRTCAMSVVNLKALDQLAAVTRELYLNAEAPGNDYSPQRFDPLSKEGYLFDLADYIDAHSQMEAELLDRWHSALENAVVYRAATPKIWGLYEINAHCGLSTYILPSASYASTRGYDTLQWWTDVASAKF